MHSHYPFKLHTEGTGCVRMTIASPNVSYKLRDEIKAAAKRQGISRSEWCRRAFTHMLEYHNEGG